MTTSRFCFPCLFLVPAFEPARLDLGGARVSKRLWETSTFDLATLATQHRLHLRYQLMDVFLSSCNLEFEVDAGTPEEAIRRVKAFRLLLFLEGVSPFIFPFFTTHSVNEYSGINSRDSSSLRTNLPEGLRDGITSKDATVEAWGNELAMSCVMLGKSELQVTEAACRNAAATLPAWLDMEEKHPPLRTACSALETAPMIPDMGSSLLHLWQGIEGLFSSVNSEVSFRISVLIAELCSAVEAPAEVYKRARESYGERSKAAHGRGAACNHDAWVSAWSLLVTCLKAVRVRGSLPKENELFEELFQGRKAGLPASVQ